MKRTLQIGVVAVFPWPSQMEQMRLNWRRAQWVSERGTKCVANVGGYFTTACNAIGALPVYVDVNLLDAQINPDAAIAALTDRTKAIVVTHYSDC